VGPAGNCSNDTPWTEKAKSDLCLICGRSSVPPGVTVLGRVLCLPCMKTISQIDVYDGEYPVIAEKLKTLWEPVLAEALRRKDQD
jgi:hypothetical protein